MRYFLYSENSLSDYLIYFRSNKQNMSEEGEEEKMFKVAKWKCELVNSYFKNDMDIDKSSGYEESGDIKEEFSGMRAESSNDQLGRCSRDRCRFPHITESEMVTSNL